MKNDLLPVLFIGHGSPMNIVQDNSFTRDLQAVGQRLSRPKAVLVVSAHWLTQGVSVTAAKKPAQIYDFWGFPDELYHVEYTAPGSPETAESVATALKNQAIVLDKDRGIDHAAWAVLVHMFPEQNIPVMELSLDMRQKPEFHFQLGKELQLLREQGVLIIGSGNIVHNLREISFEDRAEPFSWADEFDSLVKEALIAKDYDALVHYEHFGSLAHRAIPTNDHYLPMLYVLGLMRDNERVEFVHESIQNGSISMRCFQSVLE